MATLSHSHIPRRGVSRIGASGLRIRTTNLTDNPSSNFKAQAIASTDWRKTASGTPSTGSPFSKVTATNRKRDARSSSDMSSTFMLEMDNMAQAPTMYRPKEERAAWEMVVSAPAGMLSASPSSTRLSLNEVTAVQFRDAKPLTMNVNGEDIVLDNSFTFDIIPMELNYSSDEDDTTKNTVGFLRRLENQSSVQRAASRGIGISGNLPYDIRAMLYSRQKELGRARDESDYQADQSDTGRRKVPASDQHSSFEFIEFIDHAPATSLRTRQLTMEHDKARFQGMLSRLRKSFPNHHPTSRPAPDIRAIDPATISAKAKEVVPPPEGINVGKQNEPVLSHPGQTVWVRREQGQSHDSGYSSGSSLQLVLMPSAASLPSESVPHATGKSRKGRDENLTKRLNPAAAEFKSSVDEEANPFVSPKKKMARTPLTNLFPEATQNPAEKLASAARERHPPEMAQILEDLVNEQQRLPNSGTATQDSSGVYPDHLSLAYRGDPVSLSMPFTMNEAMNSPLGGDLARSFANNFGTYPSPVMAPPPVDLGPFNTTTMSRFGTFPGMTIPPLVTPFMPSASFSGPPPAAFMPLPTPHTLAGHPPLFGTDRKINRPHFPVTQKPRDHDPLKQQQYEAYLEWRKVNEPGYHMRCKMRQAQRIVRQHQQQQDQQSNPAWRAIVEKAKAAVGAVAAAAAAEKKTKEKAVRQELKSKVRERSEDSAGTIQRQKSEACVEKQDEVKE